MDLCVLCTERLDDGRETVTLRSKGCDRINEASKERNDDINVVPGQRVHSECRLKYTNVHYIAQKKRKSLTPEEPVPSRRLRSETVFRSSTDCLFCGQDTAASRMSSSVFPVRTDNFQSTISDKCQKRQDAWADGVHGKIQYCQDLHAADAVYHQECSVNFRTDKEIPKAHAKDDSSKGVKRGRPSNADREAVFGQVMQYLQENDDEQITINGLVKRMEDGLKGTDSLPYSSKHMKRRLQEQFGDEVIIAEIDGKPNVVTLRSTAEKILHDFYFLPKKDDPEAEKIRLIETAAKLIKNDIKICSTAYDSYPTSDQMESVQRNIEYLPVTLQLFLQNLFVGKETGMKVASIGQAIMQSVRPRVMITPLQLGLAVQMHRQFGSRFLVDSLNSHGFCSSYSEVQKYERSAAVHQGTEIPGFVQGSCLQHIADNVDHNVRTIDGFNTFHGMGIIATVTPGTISRQSIPKINVTSADVAAVGRLNIRYYQQFAKGMGSLQYTELPEMQVHDKTANADILWKTSWILRPSRPSWNGFMQMVHEGGHPGQSSVVFMPMIDMKSSDESCIYSTMCFVSDQARRYNVTPVLTFDQPLWWKAMEIQQNEPPESNVCKIVLRLGGLHVEMSFLGCIGHIMGGSGIEELLETVYAENAVIHMLTGKAISRALRGHILVETVLNALLMSEAYGIPLPKSAVTEKEIDENPVEPETYSGERMEVETAIPKNLPDPRETQSHESTQASSVSESNDVLDQVVSPENSSHLRAVQEIIDRLLSHEIRIEDISSDETIARLEQKLKECRNNLASLRTSKLWLQYLDMIEILRCFIKAERTGDWHLHLETLSEMLPYFAASGHNLYAKSVYLYLQSMSKLNETHPDVYQQFENGYHVVRRSDRYWAGLSTDLVIEQVLMRSMKTCGGLTRGRGMSETQRTVWLLSTPACAEINRAMQEFTGIYYSSSEQHVDSREARISRDHNDMMELLQFLEARNPFRDDPALCNVATGVTADDTVNVDKAKEVGTSVIKSLVGKRVSGFSFKKKDQVITLKTKSSVKIDNETVQVDPQLLFQRLIFVARGKIPLEQLPFLFTYELCTYPPALFDRDGLIREANKPVLAGEIWASVSSEYAEIPTEVQYVLDGGSLLQRIPWPKGTTYEGICNLYVDYITKKYGKGTVVVFDGYTDEPSTKDTAHLRRTAGQTGKSVNFVGDMKLNLKKNTFLANTSNKQRFINMLSERLQANEIKTIHATGDADVLIVLTAAESALTKPTVVIGEDTDLLVLLCHYAVTGSCKIFLTSEAKHNVKTPVKVWDIHLTKEKLGNDICQNILFIHAVLGCDTTSRLYGIGKGVSLKKYQTDGQFRQLATVFDDDSASKEAIAEAGEKALVILYNGNKDEKLDTLRMHKFHQKVATSVKFVGPESIPPTSAAATYHSFRVYHQVQTWKGNRLRAEDWGWQVKKGKLVAIQTDKAPAPEQLLNVIVCKCKTDCRSARCTCRKHGLECSVMCGECRGVSCMNAPERDSDETEI